MTTPDPFWLSRRGTALAAFIGALVIVQLLVIAVGLRATHDAELMTRSIEGMQALYAAEGGLNLAYREIALSADEDGDGTVGGISDDDNPANDPLIGPGAAVVSLEAGALAARGRSGPARRAIIVDLSAGGGAGRSGSAPSQTPTGNRGGGR